MHETGTRVRALSVAPAGADRGPYPGKSTRQPLCPPKPNEFDTTGPGSQSLGRPVTRSSWNAGSRLFVPTVGGICRYLMLRATATASIAPAAASVWPTTPLIEVAGGPGAPKTLNI